MCAVTLLRPTRGSPIGRARSLRPSGRLPANGRRRREGGQATIEFALILPLLLLLLLGILKAGLVYNDYINLTDAVRVGTRQLTLSRGLADPCTPAINRTIAAAGSRLELTPEQITINPPCTPDPSGGYTGQLDAGAAVTLTATAPCDLVLLGINFAPGCTLRASATETVE